MCRRARSERLRRTWTSATLGTRWRWVDAGSSGLSQVSKSLITFQDDHNLLWAVLGEGAETEQIEVDFNHEVILTLDSGRGVNFGPCGARIDGVIATSEALAIGWFQPGGQTGCPAELNPATYAGALDLAVFGEPPLRVALRSGPQKEQGECQLVEADGFVGTTTAPPNTEPPPPTDPPTTLAPVVPETAPPAEESLPAGLVSAPLFANRLGGLDSGFDGPLLPEWEQSGSNVSAGIVGRGGYSVAAYPIDSRDWEFAVSPPPGFFMDAGPVAVSLPVYKLEGSGCVTTSEIPNATEYRYSSDESIVEHVVRWFELRDQVFLITVGYPNFAKMSVVPNPLTSEHPQSQ
jgi:hypothetical protein